MLNLSTVYDYAQGIRFLLQDLIEPFRYGDNAILDGLNRAMMEGLRIRPDLFITRYDLDIPTFTAINTDLVPIEPQFRRAFEYVAASYILSSDEEDVQDARANSFEARFYNLLLGVRANPVMGSTPSQMPNQEGGG